MVAGFNFSAPPFSPLVVSNRGPCEVSPDGQVRRGSGGLVTAVSTLVDRTRAPWIACARTEAERTLARMSFSDLGDGHRTVRVHYVDSDPETYRKHYSVVSNQALWPIQHRLPDLVPEGGSLRDAWAHGYSVLNGLIGRRTAEVARRLPGTPVVLIHPDRLQGRQPRVVMLHCHELHHAAGGMDTLLYYSGLDRLANLGGSYGNSPE
jgi:trehalose 6-phosphate synthase